MRKRIKLTERDLRSLINSVKRKTINENADLTAGDVRNAIKHLLDSQLKKAGKEGLKGAAIDLGTMAAKSAAGALSLGISDRIGDFVDVIAKGKELYDLWVKAHEIVNADLKEKNPFWDHVTIDPDKSKIMDDRVEQEFIKWLSNEINGMPDSAKIPDADTVLGAWMKRKFNKHSINSDS
jgi:uncharacterized membrane protein YheB (UPF0754 family)